MRKVNEKNEITKLENEKRKCFGRHNKGLIIGKIVGVFKITYNKNDGRKFYNARVRVERLTDDKYDIVPVVIQGNMIKKKDIQKYLNKIIRVTGEFRSFIRNGHKKHFLYAKTFEIYDQEIPEESNLIFLEGYLSNVPMQKIIYEEKQKIAIFCIAVHRSASEEKSDYINCVAWRDNAEYVSAQCVGKKLRLYGRMQSRKHGKEKKEVYEVSVTEIH